MRVIGTAGHVDHGKSTLVEALTGINPDRLKEERERQMTIDLGFAWLTLPGGESVGVIDVPGHRDFIENMLAGVGGIDAALMVIAADEGLMPQTREHLAILDLLQIGAGVIALTKCDLVEAEWRDLMAAEVAAAVRGTVLAAAPIIPVSARTGSGLPELRAALEQVLRSRPARPDLGRPRLPVDRVFSVAGFGAVVTGTLRDGSLAVGDEVEILPGRLPARVRGLQTHKSKVLQAVPGSRAAANLSGVEVGQLRRGMVVGHPGALQSTRTLDARFQYLPDAGAPLAHNAQVKLFIDASETIGRLRLLDADTLAPGEQGWVQLTLAEPVVAAKGDRFILRRPSPGETIGGGTVIDPQPSRLHRRRDQIVLTRLETMARGSPGEMLAQSLNALGPAALKDALQRAGLDGEVAETAVGELRAGGELLELDGEALVITRERWAGLGADIHSALEAYHLAHPLRAGMPREELKSRLQLSARVFQAIVSRAQAEGRVAASGAAVRLAGHAVKFSSAEQAKIDELLSEFRRDPYNTPLVRDVSARVGAEVLAALLDAGQVVQVSKEVLLLRETYEASVEQIKGHLRAHGQVTVAEVRDLLNTSRKYALALMEHLDETGVTRRVGDERVLK